MQTAFIIFGAIAGGVFFDEFKDMARTKSMFVFEDIPYGVPGNTGDVNIASIYASDTISLLPEGGLRLSAFMAPEDDKEFQKGWNGTWNTKCARAPPLFLSLVVPFARGAVRSTRTCVSLGARCQPPCVRVPLSLSLFSSQLGL